MPDRTKNLPSKLTVDFSDVGERREGGGKSIRLPEGDYLLQVEDADVRPTKDGSGKFIAWRTSVVEPKEFAKKGSLWTNTSLKKEALWKLRNMLEDMGVKVPKSIVDVPLAKIVAKHLQFGATVQDGEPYGDKQTIKSEIVATFPKAEYKSAGKAASDDDDDEDEEETTTEASSDDDEDEDLDELDVDDI